LTVQLIVEGADHGCTFLHNCCGKPCPWWGLRVSWVLPKLWDSVHELGKHPLNPQQFPGSTKFMFLPCWAVKV